MSLGNCSLLQSAAPWVVVGILVVVAALAVLQPICMLRRRKLLAIAAQRAAAKEAEIAFPKIQVLVENPAGDFTIGTTSNKEP